MPEKNIQQNRVEVKGQFPCMVLPHWMVDVLLPTMGRDCFLILVYLIRRGPSDSMPTFKEFKESAQVTPAKSKAAIARLRDEGILNWMPSSEGQKATFSVNLDALSGARARPDDASVYDLEFEPEEVEILRKERSPEEMENIPPILRRLSDDKIDTCLAVWQAWLDALPPDRCVVRYQLTHDRARRILQGIKWGFTSEELVMAVKGWKYDPWDKRVDYMDLRHIFKSIEHTEMFIRYYKTGSEGRPVGKQAPSRYRKLGNWE